MVNQHNPEKINAKLHSLQTEWSGIKQEFNKPHLHLPKSDFDEYKEDPENLRSQLIEWAKEDLDRLDRISNNIVEGYQKNSITSGELNDLMREVRKNKLFITTFTEDLRDINLEDWVKNTEEEYNMNGKMNERVNKLNERMGETEREVEKRLSELEGLLDLSKGDKIVEDCISIVGEISSQIDSIKKEVQENPDLTVGKRLEFDMKLSELQDRVSETYGSIQASQVEFKLEHPDVSRIIKSKMWQEVWNKVENQYDNHLYEGMISIQNSLPSELEAATMLAQEVPAIAQNYLKLTLANDKLDENLSAITRILNNDNITNQEKTELTKEFLAGSFEQVNNINKFIKEVDSYVANIGEDNPKYNAVKNSQILPDINDFKTTVKILESKVKEKMNETNDLKQLIIKESHDRKKEVGMER